MIYRGAGFTGNVYATIHATKSKGERFMEGVTEVDRFIFTIVALSIAFIILFMVAAVVERAYEREQRRNQPRPKLPERERDLLGDDWRDHAGRWSR